MKNTIRYLFISLLFFLMPQAVMADGIEDAEVIYSKCLKKTKGVTFDMRECAYEYTVNLKKHLNKVWQALITERHEAYEMDDKHKSAILSSLQEEQKKWEEYEKIACQSLADTLWYGTAGFIYAFTCGHLVIEQRIEILLHELCAPIPQDNAPDVCRETIKEQE